MFMSQVKPSQAKLTREFGLLEELLVVEFGGHEALARLPLRHLELLEFVRDLGLQGTHLPYTEGDGVRS
jgi:hypothetical protein